jgi:hypothetical protein
LANALETEAYKHNLHPVRLKYADVLYQIHDLIWDLMKEYGVEKSKLLPKGEKVDGKLLQLLGTEWGRYRNPNLWVEIMRNKIHTHGRDKFIIIDDCRFPNELAPATRAFTVRVRLECDEETRRQRAEKWREDTSHPSEVSLNGRPELFDLVFDTSSNRDSVEEMVFKILEKVL